MLGKWLRDQLRTEAFDLVLLLGASPNNRTPIHGCLFDGRSGQAMPPQRGGKLTGVAEVNVDNCYVRVHFGCPQTVTGQGQFAWLKKTARRRSWHEM